MQMQGLRYHEHLKKIREEVPIFSEDKDHDKYELGSHNCLLIQAACVELGRERWFLIAEAFNDANSMNSDRIIPYVYDLNPNGMMGYVIGFTIDQLCIVGQHTGIEVAVMDALKFTKETVPPVLAIKEAARQWLDLRKTLGAYCKENLTADGFDLLRDIDEFVLTNRVQSATEVRDLDRDKVVDFIDEKCPAWDPILPQAGTAGGN